MTSVDIKIRTIETQTNFIKTIYNFDMDRANEM